LIKPVIWRWCWVLHRERRRRSYRTWTSRWIARAT
jgi:hypothetical protein